MEATYQQLTEQARILNAEREELIQVRNKLIEQYTVAHKRLEELECLVEANLIYQEGYWPELTSQDVDIQFMGDVVSKFKDDPNLTLEQLAKMFKVSACNVSRILSKHYQYKNIQPTI